MTNVSAAPSAAKATASTSQVGAEMSTERLSSAQEAAVGKPVVTVRQVMARFVAMGFVALLVASGAGSWAAHEVAEREAVADAKQLTNMLADHVVEPALTDDLVEGDPEALRRMDELVRTQVLGHEVLRVKLWTPQGRVVYSDAAALVGKRYTLDQQVLAVLRQGDAAASTTDLSRPENRLESQLGPLLEVYAAVRTPSGRPLLFETYQSGSTIAAQGNEIRRNFGPIVIGGLILLLGLLVPLAWTLTRRLEQASSERERLLRHALNASMNERRRIAAHLHDGIVQSFAGVSYVLAGAADSLAADGRFREAAIVSGAGDELRQGVRGLRSLLVEIYPPALRRAGLQTALSDLTAQLSSRGIEVDLDLEHAAELEQATEAVLFQAAQEAVRNIVTHSGATAVSVAVERLDHEVKLTVRDNGRGFADSESEADPESRYGHVGLTLLAGALEEVGGTLSVDSTVGHGTTLIARVPIR
jgi:two-component system NarL family sensor kinase